MADYRVPFQPANHLPENPLPPSPFHRPHGHELRAANHYVAGDDQQDVQRGGVVPQPVGNVAMQGQMWYPYHIDAPHYNAAQYYPPPPPNPEAPYMHMHRDVRAAQGVPVQAHAFAPEVQENHDGPFGYGARFPAADPPDAFPGIWHHPAPLANMPPYGLRNLAGRYRNNPNTRVNVVRIEPGPGGRFEVWIALELADIF